MTSPNNTSSSGSTSSGSASTGSGSGSSSTTPLGDTSTADAIVSSARNKRDDFDYGDDRVIVNPPNWAAQSSEQLYFGAVNDNDPSSADALGSQWTGQGDDLLHAADVLYEAITELSGAWVGKASGAAQGSLIGVANASSTAGDAARAMGKRLHDQAVAAAEVKKMPAPVKFNMDQAIAAGLAGGPAAITADIKAQSDKHDAVLNEQQQYMNVYTKSMSDVDGSTPSFGEQSIGFKPMAGTSLGSGNAASASSASAGDAGLSVSSISGGVGSSVGGLGQLGSLGAAGGLAGAGSGAEGAQISHAGLQQPLTTTGTGHVSTTATGPGAAAAVGTAALGAGLGFAGAKAFGKGKDRDNKKDQPQDGEPTDEAATPEGEGAEAAEGAESQQIGDLANAPHVGQPGASVAGGSGQPVHGPGAAVPHVGAPMAGQPAGSYQPVSMPVGPEFSAPPQPQAPYTPQAAPLADGVQSGAAAAPADPAATSSVAAGSEAQHHGPASAGPQPGQSYAQQAQAAGMAPTPMQPMGGAGAGMGAGAGAGGVGGMGGDVGEHAAASYLIKPDPDDVFGPTESVTSGVIGEDPEDD